MLRLAAQRSSLGTGVRSLLATTSVAKQQERSLHPAHPTEKVVVVNLGGVVQTMAPVIRLFAQKFHMNEDAVKNALLVEGDEAVTKTLTPLLTSRHGSHKANTYDLIGAVKSLQGEGWKTVLIDEARLYESVPFDKDVFCLQYSTLPDDLAYQFNLSPSDIVYLDNSEAHLKSAADLGFSTVNVGEDVHKALTELESIVKVPLKVCIEGLTFNWFDRANNPYTSKRDNLFYIFLVTSIFGLIVIGPLVPRRCTGPLEE